MVIMTTSKYKQTKLGQDWTMYIAYLHTSVNIMIAREHSSRGTNTTHMMQSSTVGEKKENKKVGNIIL